MRCRASRSGARGGPWGHCARTSHKINSLRKTSDPPPTRGCRGGEGRVGSGRTPRRGCWGGASGGFTERSRRGWDEGPGTLRGAAASTLCRNGRRVPSAPRAAVSPCPDSTCRGCHRASSPIRTSRCAGHPDGAPGDRSAQRGDPGGETRATEVTQCYTPPGGSYTRTGP